MGEGKDGGGEEEEEEEEGSWPSRWSETRLVCKVALTLIPKGDQYGLCGW